MDDLRVVARIKPLVVLRGEHDEPVLDEDIAVGPFGVAMTDTQQLGGPSGLAGGDMDADAEVLAELHHGLHVSLDGPHAEPTLGAVDEPLLESGLALDPPHQPLGPG